MHRVLAVLSLSPPHPQSGAPASLRLLVPWRAPQGYQAPHTHRWLPLAPGTSDPSRPTTAWEPHSRPLLPLPCQRAACCSPPRCGAHRVSGLIPGWTCCFAHPHTQPLRQPQEVESALKLSVAGAGGLGMLRSQGWLWSQVGSFCTREAAATLGKVDRRGEEAPRRAAAAGRSPRQPGGAWAPCGICSTRSRRRSRS